MGNRNDNSYLETQINDIANQLANGTAGIDDAVTVDNKVWSSAQVQQEISNFLNLPSVVHVSETKPANLQEGEVWFEIVLPEGALPITDYFFRFDASSLALADNAKVAQWNDLSGNANHLIQTTEAKQPTYLATGFNGKPTVQFSSSHMDKTSFSLDRRDKNTVFVVLQATAPTTSSSLFGFIKDSNAPIYFGMRISGSVQKLMSQPGGTDGAGVALDSSLFLFTHSWDAINTKAYKNGALAATVAYAPAIDTLHNRLLLGNNAALTAPFAGKISEIVYFSRALTVEERVSVESYLITKWGIA